MAFYHIDRDYLTIKAGPFQMNSTEMKRAWREEKHEHRGNFETASLDELRDAGIVPEQHEVLQEGQEYGPVLVELNAVVYPAVQSTPTAILLKTKDALDAAIEEHMDEEARKRDYNSIESMCTYATDPDPQYRAEGIAGVAWRSAVWRYAEGVADAVLSGTRVPPTKAELLAELPVIQWTSTRVPVRNKFLALFGL